MSDAREWKCLLVVEAHLYDAINWLDEATDELWLVNPTDAIDTARRAVTSLRHAARAAQRLKGR